jgi:titin
VLLAATATGNLVLGNNVGTDYSGQKAVGNSLGIEVMGSDNTLGGTASAARNIVSGNSSDGVLLDSGASGTVLLGNLIGINAANKALANSGNGLDVLSINNTIGGTATGARNVLSGNSKDGLLLASGGNGNQVLGNYIGTNVYASAALGNGTNGVEIGGAGNTVGGTATAARNIISGNTGDGVLIESGASGNQVLGNSIGINSGGNTAIGNGIGIEDAGSGNILGGSVSAARNVISGNSNDGILLDSAATGEVVQSNFLGLNAGYGNTAIANGKNGVEVQGTNNTIGGTVLAERNYLSGNSNDGLFLGSSSSGNLVLDNFVGIDLSGTHGVANLNGVEIAGNNNILGGTVSGYRNIISGNSNDGVLIDSTAANNLIQGNDVGTDYTGQNVLANSGNGVEIAGSNNMVGGSVSGAGNVIANNSKAGVLVSAGSGNTIRRNAIYNNAGPGISLSSGANNNIVAPTLSSATLSGSTLTVQASFNAPTANVSYALEFFANPSGDAEGKIYLGSLTVTPTTTGVQTFTYTTTTTVTGANPLITATLTDNTGDTSELSNGVTVS